jgi:hypothetical protein
MTGLVSRLWIGLAEVVPIDRESPITGAGAFVNVVGPGDSPAAFRSSLERAAAGAHLSVLDLEEVELLEDRLRSHSVDDETMQAISAATASGRITFGTFHNYPTLDA